LSFCNLLLLSSELTSQLYAVKGVLFRCSYLVCHTGMEAKSVLSQSGLVHTTLAQIWFVHCSIKLLSHWCSN